jgi:hypothetical protein
MFARCFRKAFEGRRFGVSLATIALVNEFERIDDPILLFSLDTASAFEG